MAKTVMVKCMATGQRGPRDEYFKAPNGRYFQSEAVYQEWIAGRRTEKASKKKTSAAVKSKVGRTPESYEKICKTLGELIGYELGGTGEPMPANIFKKLKGLDWYSDEIIQEALDRNFNSIKWALVNKNFTNPYSKASYMMAIVENKVSETYHMHLDQEKAAAQAENVSVDAQSYVDLSDAGPVRKNNDVSSLLGDDDLWS